MTKKPRPTRICQHCQSTYQPRRLTKQLKFCSADCQRATGLKKRTIPDRNCEKCNIEFRPKASDGRFCSLSCAASVNTKKRGPRSEDTRERIRATMKQRVVDELCIPPSPLLSYPNRIGTPRKPRGTCPICNTLESVKPSKRTCGSESCMKARLGGYRERSGRGKTGYYRGIFCNSQWELAYLIWMFDHGRNVIRNTQSYSYADPDTGRPRKFYPDFITEEGLIEIKGWGRRSGINAAKMAAVDQPIRFLYEVDLEDVFTYIAQRYGKSRYNVFELYEDRPNKRITSCRICGSEFEVRKKAKGLYCSAQCSIRANHSSKKLVALDGADPSTSP